jgi:hypothetical protein
MSTTAFKSPTAIRTLETQLRGVKAVLDWEDVAKELGIKPPPKRAK